VRGRRLGEKQLQRFEELYRAEESIKDIATELECSTAALYRWRRILGLKSRLANNPTVRPEALDRALWGENQTLKAIVGRYGFNSRWNLVVALKHAGVPLKHQGLGLHPKIWCRLAPGGCLKCSTTERPHSGRGLCKLCWQRSRKDGTLDFYITEAEMGRMYAEAEEAKEIDVLH